MRTGSRFTIYSLIAVVCLSSVQAAQTNAPVNQVIKASVDDVRKAIQTFVASTNNPSGFTFRTNDVPGVSYQVEFMDCQPPIPRTIWPAKMWPALRMVGWRPPQASSHWSGTFVARRESKYRTRLSVIPKSAKDQLSEVYLDGILEKMPPKP
jgi:hypothetical protein